ncbi:PREDICTED: zinc finger protein 570-like isoform X1 [Poecilia mexicana]|uniref:zinc finger protein 570-like isoform X1 n=1 Tax=Poecilia mexicana TaxID=48701 RepID=UPI00072EDC6C|nr:PREDICTED: zinc finger protein 570-like isoform X1 [Poecilia mexicana]
MCSVVGCESWRRRAQHFILPADPERRLEWVQFLFEVNGQRLKETSWTDIRVCSEHFTSNCFLTVTRAGGSTQLKSDAVPSVCSPDEPESKQLNKCHGPTQGSSTLNKEENCYLTSVPASPASSEASESSSSDYCKMLEKIENLDIIKEKVSMLRTSKRYIVNEKQLLRLFCATCPVCQSEVKTEKVVCGVLLVLNQQCRQCGYKNHWKNLTQNSITAMSEDHQTKCMEIFLEATSTKTAAIAENVEVVDEESDPTTETEESSDPGEVKDSDDSWDPETEDSWDPDDELSVLESENESSGEEVHLHGSLKVRELCADCGMFFVKRKPHTCEYKIKPFSCNTCGRRYATDHALTLHNRVHSANYEHSCKYCRVGFKTKVAKKAHEQTHLNESDPFKCPECPERFATYTKRKNHMRRHLKPGPLKCPVCGIEFFWAVALQRHSMVHTGEKPFECSVCQRAFKQPSHLKSHMRLHTGERPYKCKQCDKCFNHNVSLKSHVRRYHQQKTTNPKGCADGDLEVEEAQLAEKETKTRRRPGRTLTGRPVGRPKKNHRVTMTEEKNDSGRAGKPKKTAKVRKRKPKKKPSSSEEEEEEEELSESEQSLDLMEEEEQ